MKRGGCTQITLSVESGSPRVLKEIIREPMKLEIVPPNSDDISMLTDFLEVVDEI